MNAVFLKVLQLSFAAACIVVVILALRLFLRRAPKWIMCCLWLLVAVRLVFPFTIESVLSMQPDIDNITSSVTATTPPQNLSNNSPAVGENVEQPNVQSPVNPGNSTVIQPGNSTVIQPGNSNVTVNPGAEGIVEQSVDWMSILSVVWLVGMGVMAAYAIGSILVLRLRLSASAPLEKGIRQNDFVDSPFVLGVFRPTIYLPNFLSSEDREFVVAHEKAHISRGDHLWKPFGFVLLAIHWFNPLLWVAYVMLCRDIEAACDEKVIRQYTKEERQAYSLALLNCSYNRRSISACPVAFGEVGVKNRIKGVMNYKKPSFWIVIVALLAGIAVAVTFLTSPPEGKEDEPSPSPSASPTATPTPAPDLLNYNVPPVKMDVVWVKEDCVQVKFWLDGNFDGARVFTNGPFELKRLVNGTWETIDASFMHLERWIMEIPEFQNAPAINIWLTRPERFVGGETYRISVPLTTDRDPSKGKEYSVCTEFVCSIDDTAYPWVGHYPQDLANLDSNYSLEQVELDGGFVTNENHVIIDGEGFFDRLLSWISQDVSFVMRFAVDRDKPYENSFNDFVFDGTKYTIRTLIDEENKTVVSHDYKYLMRFEGPKETPDAEYDYFERYVLTNSADVTWEDILAGKYTDYYVLVLNPIVYQNGPALKQNITKITLEYKGEVVGQVTSPNTCALIREILSRSGEYHMEDYCTCGWYTVDEELQMVFWYDDGTKDVVNPIRSEEVVVFGETHYNYINYHAGRGSMMKTIRDCFGLSDWPQ